MGEQRTPMGVMGEGTRSLDRWRPHRAASTVCEASERAIVWAAVFALVACESAELRELDAAGGPRDAEIDADPRDASVDAGPLDAGTDAGPLDAGPLDTGPLDASIDAGPHDAGPVDLGTLDADTRDAEADAARDSGPLRYVLGDSVRREAVVGGPGGVDYERPCDEGGVLVGHSGAESPTGFDYWYQARCAYLEDDGSLGVPRAAGMPVAADSVGCGVGLVNPWMQDCPEGQAAVGLHGWTVTWDVTDATVLARIALVCAPLDEWTTDGTGDTPLAEHAPLTDPTAVAFDTRCDPGEVMTEIVGKQGCLIDSIGIGCRAIERVP